MQVDPDGRDSYYTKSGEYIMTDDKETDNIIIRNQYLSKMKSIAGTEWNNPDTPLTDADLSAEAYSAIYTDILKRNGFDINKLKNGQVSIVKLKDNTIKDGSQYEADGFYNHDAVIPFHNAPIAQCAVVDSQYEVTAYSHPMGDDNREYLSTVSNVVSVLGVHEFTGHGLFGISGKQHWRILGNQREHSSWKKTSPKLKELYRNLETNKIDHYNRPK